MQPEVFRRLLSADGQRALSAAEQLSPREADFLKHFQWLSQRFDPDLARAALEIAILRQKAREKFPFGERLFFTREALEQASNWEVSTYRARRYRDFACVLDLGCSIGGDSFALGRVAPTLGIERDPLRLAMARANARILELDRRLIFLLADLTAALPMRLAGESTGVFFDPARRSRERRLRSIREYSPPLALVEVWHRQYAGLGAKISPGVDLAEVGGYDAEIEFISLHGELKEAVLWFGALKSAVRRATLLPGGYTLVSDRSVQLAIGPPGAFIYEPDPAVLRASMVGILGAELGAWQLDPDIAYLTGDDLKATPFAHAWMVQDWMPFSLKRLRAYLRQRGVGRVTIKKRGSPLQPEALAHALKLSGSEERVLFLTHYDGKPIVIVALPPVLERGG